MLKPVIPANAGIQSNTLSFPRTRESSQTQGLFNMIKENLIDLDIAQLRLLKKLIKAHIPGKTVWAYGSRVKWRAEDSSDLDLAVFDCSDREIGDLKEALEESNLLISVDVLDWESIPENFKTNIQKKYVVLQKSPNLAQSRNQRRQSRSVSLPTTKWKTRRSFPQSSSSPQSLSFPQSSSFPQSPSFPRKRESRKSSFTSARQNPAGWQTVKLGEVAQKIITGKTPSKNNPEDWGDKMPFITPTDYAEYRKIAFSAKRRLSNKGIDRLSKKIIPSKASMVTCIGSDMGKVCMNGLPVITNQQINSIVPNINIIDRDFLYYRLVSIHKKLQAYSRSGTAVPIVNKSVFSRITFSIPLLLSEQRAIAEILSSLDDKVELLHQQNKVLEGMAQALFRHWFIENAKPHWKKQPLSYFLDTIESGSRPKGGIDSNLKQGIPSIGAESINGIGNFDFSKTKYVTDVFFKKMQRGQIQDYDILIYKDGAYIGKKSMFGKGFPFKEMVVNEHVFILRPNSKAKTFFTYFALEPKKLAKLNANSAQPGLNQQTMKSFEIISPPENKINQFGFIVKEWVDRILFNSSQIRTLENLRNTLLPKLITGQMRIQYLDRS